MKIITDTFDIQTFGMVPPLHDLHHGASYTFCVHQLYERDVRLHVEHDQLNWHIREHWRAEELSRYFGVPIAASRTSLVWPQPLTWTIPLIVVQWCQQDAGDYHLNFWQWDAQEIQPCAPIRCACGEADATHYEPEYEDDLAFLCDDCYASWTTQLAELAAGTQRKE